MAELSQSGRQVYLVTVSQGQVYYALAGDTAWTLANNLTGEDPPLNFTGTIFSSANNQLLYFADGVNWCYFKPSDGTVNTWVASAGSLPVDVDDNTPRLIETWRGRTVVAGLIKDPQDWFMSAVSDPTNWDYSPQFTAPTQAVAGEISPLGLVGDVITGMIPFTDDLLIFGGDHSLWMLSGDPMLGGQLDVVSKAIGMAWGRAWCMDPYGNIYFFSNKTGIYSFVPGQKPQRISQPIENLINTIDTGANAIRLLWNDRFQGLHVFVTPLDGPEAATHFYWDQRTGGWFEDQFANPNHNPISCCTFDGNLPGDRHPLIGSWDGYVRAIDPTAATDDGTAIESAVVIGPLLTADLDEMLLKDMQAVLGATSGSVSYAIYVGPTAEIALSSTPVATGVWSAGRNLTNPVRRSGHAVYVQLSSSNAWTMEAVRMRVATQGKVRRRGP